MPPESESIIIMPNTYKRFAMVLNSYNIPTSILALCVIYSNTQNNTLPVGLVDICIPGAETGQIKWGVD